MNPFFWGAVPHTLYSVPQVASVCSPHHRVLLSWPLVAPLLSRCLGSRWLHRCLVVLALGGPAVVSLSWLPVVPLSSRCLGYRWPRCCLVVLAPDGPTVVSLSWPQQQEQKQPEQKQLKQKQLLKKQLEQKQLRQNMLFRV